MYKVIKLTDKSYEVLIDGESVYYPCYDDLPPSAKDQVNKMIKTKKSKFKKAGEQSGFDMRGLN
jgi:hypothetical protein